MSCPHGLRSTPETCSQCLAAPVKRIDIADRSARVDGVPVRKAETPSLQPRRRRRREHPVEIDDDPTDRYVVAVIAPAPAWTLPKGHA